MDTAGAVQDPGQRSSGQQPQQQWDRFEVVLSKPSGSQKLGMVLKHAQVTISPCLLHPVSFFEQPRVRRSPPCPPPALLPVPPPPPPTPTCRQHEIVNK